MLKSKILGALTVMLAVAATTTSCSSDEDSGTLSDGTLNTCADFTDPPFNFYDGKKQEGFDPDFLKGLTEGMEVKLSMKDTRFASLIPALKAGRCDAIASFMYVNPERAKVVDFIPYAESGVSFLVHGDQDFMPKELTDLCGYSVATLQGGVPDSLALETGTLGADCAKQGRPIKVSSMPNNVAAVQDLIAGRVDAFFLDSSGAVSFAKEYAAENLVISNDALLNPVVAGIAVRKGDDKTMDAITSAMTTLEDDGTLEEIREKYGLKSVGDGDFEDALAGRPVGAS